jgi:hypothetical protein
MANEISGPVEALSGELVTTLREGLGYIADEHVYSDADREHLSRVVAALDQLAADAQRFNGLRMLMCEPDASLKDRMLDAIESHVNAFVAQHTDEVPTPELINELVDRMLLAACEARK